MTVSRRQFLDGLQTICAVEFMRACVGTKAYAASLATNIDRWRIEWESLARDFRGDGLTLSQWRAAIEELNNSVPMADLLKLVDFETIQRRLLAFGPGEHSQRTYLPSISDVPRPFSSTIFSVSAGAQVAPHAHNNQVTAHLLIRGQLHTRTFERRHDIEGTITVVPERDALLGVGTTVAMSSERENVHWLIAQKEPAFSFQISAGTPQSLSMPEVNRAQPGGRVYLDLRGKPERDGAIRARVIGPRESQLIYGA